MPYTNKNIIRGGIIYGAGDTIAAFIQDDFSLARLFGVLLIGATVYAYEIPNYFNWIEKRSKAYSARTKWMGKTLWAIVYFNPIWIARHLLFIKIFSGSLSDISFDLLRIGLWSFVVNIPISLIANYIIQNKINLDWRFVGSAIFSGLMAIYYALSLDLF